MHYWINKQPFITINEGCIRTGKTMLNNWLWLQHIENNKNENKNFIMSGRTVATLKHNVLDELSSIFGIDTKLNQYNEFYLFGNRIICKGADNIQSFMSIKGMTAAGWYANEINTHHQELILEGVSRCSEPNSKILWDCNPDNPAHFVKVNYIDKADGKMIYVKHWQLEDNQKQLDSKGNIINNGFLTEEYITNLKNSTPQGVFYDRNILGLWVAAEGAIYRDFNRNCIIREPLYPIEKYYAGVDWGINHYGVIEVFGEDSIGNVYLVKEIAEKNELLPYWIKRKKELENKYKGIIFYADTENKDNRLQFGALPARKDVMAGINYVASLMKENKFYIIQGEGELFLKEVGNYRWADKSDKDAVIKENDDACDSVRYALYTASKKSGGVIWIRKS
jgi:PBSX family phage terminase large subunit